jgi:hypothetical protein
MSNENTIKTSPLQDIIIIAYGSWSVKNGMDAKWHGKRGVQ